MAYEFLAGSYDRLTSDVPYEDILAFYEKLWSVYGVTPSSALDLACGTGSMALLLAGKGLQTLGADASEEMLTVAYEKAMEQPEQGPYFIRQPMQRLRLPQSVEFICCCLDGINYLTNPADCKKTFARVFNSLTPGGLFVFDVNSETKLRGLNGQIFLDEDDDVFCLWRAEYEEQSRLCRYGMDIFTRRGSVWDRSREEHLEYAYRTEELCAWLTEAGFTDVRCYGDRVLRDPTPEEQRIFIAARKEQNHA